MSRSRWAASISSVGGLLLLAPEALRALESPLPVSPGTSTGALVGTACPAFSWSSVPGVRGYELVVYRVGEGGPESHPVLEETFLAAALSWTPPLDRCLERGGRYAWSVRAIGSSGESDWSAPSLFQVASGPSQEEFQAALDMVRRFLRQEEPGRASSSDEGLVRSAGLRSPGASSAGVSSAESAARSMSGGDSALQVNGSPVVTVATLDTPGSTDLANLVLCDGVPGGWRYWDLGDGTVLDCNTRKIWLKDASCLGVDTWSDPGDGTTIFTRVADLNSGTDFGCSGYTPGTFTDWEVPPMSTMCGLWDGNCSGTSCCTASQGLVDVSLSGSPKVANGKGNATWTPGNVFVGVQFGYWSATEVNALTHAWNLNLYNGNVNALGLKSNYTYYVWPVRGGQ